MPAVLTQRLVPGIVGISTYVDYVYQKEMQLAAIAAAGTQDGPINQLRSVTVTLDFNLLVQNLQAERRSAAEEQVAAACRALQAAGADFIVVTSGTTSTLTTLARHQISIPLLDLAEACWRQEQLPAKVGLLSTRYAAAGGLFAAAARRHGAELILPATDLAAEIDRVIFSDLIRGEVSPTCLRVLGVAIDHLQAAGAAAIILGNTDMTLAAGELAIMAAVPLVDAARAHARDAARAALGGEGLAPWGGSG